MLHARSHRVCAAPDSRLVPIASRYNSVICGVPICLYRAEGSALRQCRSTLSIQAGFLSALQRYPSNGGLAYDGSARARLELVDGLFLHLEPDALTADPESQKLALCWAIHRAFQRIHCESQCGADEAAYACHYPLTG